MGAALTLDKLAPAPARIFQRRGGAQPYRLSATVNEKSPPKVEGEFDMMSGAGKGNLSLGRWPSPLRPLWAPYLKATLAKGRPAPSSPIPRLTQGKQGLDW